MDIKTHYHQFLPFLLSLGAGYMFITPAWSAAPLGYGEWSETAGEISINCPVGYVCAEQISGKGMFQRLLTATSGDRYYQQIIADSGGSDGTMKLEAFILSANTPESGLASKQTIEDVDTFNSFSSTVFINTGWANQGENSVDIQQSMNSTDPVLTSVYYEDAFKYFVKRDENENNLGKYLEIYQGQLDSTLLGGAESVTTGDDRYTFVNRKSVGVFTSISGSISLFDGFRHFFNGGGMRRGLHHTSPSDGNLDWNAGDELQAIWIGSRCNNCATSGSSEPDYAFQSYENLTSGDGIAGQGNSYALQNWIDSIFGTAPVLIDY